MNSREDTMLMDRDLAALDAALSAGHADHEDQGARELQELALLLRDEAARPDEDFERVMRGRMEAGFPPKAGSRRGRLRVPRILVRPRALAAAAAALALIAALAVVVTLRTGPESAEPLSASGGSVASTPESSSPALPGAAKSADSAPRKLLRIAPPPAAGRFAPGRSSRRIERSAELELGAPADEMEHLADQVSSVTARYGGFVLSSSVSSGRKDASGGDFDLRIPAARLRPALRDLAALGALHSQTQSGRDVTRPYVTVAARLEAARAERTGLLRRLAAAGTDQEAGAIRAQLDTVDRRIAHLRSQLRGLRLSTDYASVLVTLAADDGSGGGGSFDDSLNDAGNLLVGAAGIAVRVLALALPIGLLALAGWLIGQAIRRRRRESALL